MMIIAMKIKLNKGAYMPVRGHEADAGLDLRTPERVVIYPNDSVTINTGVHVQIPFGYFGKLESKSGLNVNHGIVSHGGVIDSGYTGPVVVKLYNQGKQKYVFEQGDKIVQLIIQPCLLPMLELVDDLEDTYRGDNGFGSTGN